jgi:hypothetical protein
LFYQYTTALQNLFYFIAIKKFKSWHVDAIKTKHGHHYQTFSMQYKKEPSTKLQETNFIDKKDYQNNKILVGTRTTTQNQKLNHRLDGQHRSHPRHDGERERESKESSELRERQGCNELRLRLRKPRM